MQIRVVWGHNIGEREREGGSEYLDTINYSVGFYFGFVGGWVLRVACRNRIDKLNRVYLLNRMDHYRDRCGLKSIKLKRCYRTELCMLLLNVCLDA